MSTNLLDLADYVQKQGDLGRQRGQQDRYNGLARTAASAYGPQRDQAIADMTGIDPTAAQTFGTNLQKQDDDYLKKASGGARFVVQQYKSGGIEAARAAYRYAHPSFDRAARMNGQSAPPELDESVIPKLEMLAATADPNSDEMKSLRIGGNGNYWAIRNGQFVDTGVPAAPDVQVRDQPGIAPGLIDKRAGTIRPLVEAPSAGAAPAASTAPPAAMPAPTTSGGTGVMGDALSSAVMSVESGGNPNAVSPKGALGTMQTMPGTLRDPGYGVQAARDNSPAEMERVGKDYLAAMVQRYGLEGGLAAYNWGPGNWEAALERSGGDPQRALQMAPRETRQYVPEVMGRAGAHETPAMPQAATGVAAARPVEAKPTTRRLTPAEVAAAGYRPGSIVERNAGPNGESDRVVQAPPETKDASGGRPLPFNAVNRLTSDAEKLVNLTDLSGRFKDGFAGNAVGGSVENVLGRIGGERVGLSTPGQADWWQQYDRYKNQVRNEMFGSALTAGESAAFEAADIGPNMDPKRVRTNLAMQSRIIRGALTRQAKVWAAQGYSREAIEAATGVAVSAPAARAGRAGAGRPPTVTTKAQYDALPRGALYVEDGQTYRKP